MIIVSGERRGESTTLAGRRKSSRLAGRWNAPHRAAEKQKERLFGSRPSINRPPLRGLSHDPKKRNLCLPCRNVGNDKALKAALRGRAIAAPGTHSPSAQGERAKGQEAHGRWFRHYTHAEPGTGRIVGVTED